MKHYDTWTNTMREYIKIGPVELFIEDAEKLYNEKKYILTSSKVYAICYSKCIGYYSAQIHHKPKAGYTRPGRFHAIDAKTVNDILGFELLNA